MEQEAQNNNQAVADAWFPIKAMLDKYDGSTAMNALQSLRERDQRIWNGVYWKVNGWFVDWFRRHQRPDDRFPFDDFGHDDYVRFLIRVLGRQTWNSEDLPALLTELRMSGTYRASSGG